MKRAQTLTLPTVAPSGETINYAIRSALVAVCQASGLIANAGSLPEAEEASRILGHVQAVLESYLKRGKNE